MLKISGAFLNKILKVNAKQALYRTDGKWYHNLKEFPGVLFYNNGMVLFPTFKTYIQSPRLQIKQALHVLGGISSLPQYKLFTDYQKELINGVSIEEIIFSGNSSRPIRVLSEVNAILRRRSLVDKMKKIYKNSCQICGIRLAVGNEVYYSEVHHIIPLGNPYHGSDSLDNMLCVCPNHHVQLDFKVIPLNIDSLKLVKHKIEITSLYFHNSMIFTKYN